MKRFRNRDLLGITNDVILIGTAFSIIVVAILDSLGMLENVKWLIERIPALTLVSLGFLLLSAVLERRSKIAKMQQTLDSIVLSSTFGAQYLDDSEHVTQQIERAVQNADESIMAIGAKSRATKYLAGIEEGVAERKIVYYRLIDGEYIPHELHEHLRNLVHMPNVQISWTPREKFGNLIVTEKESVLIFPGNSIERFSGLWLPGQTNSHKYTQYFRESFSKCLPLRTEAAIEALCMICSPETAGNLTKVSRILERELDVSLKNSGVVIADNNP